MSLLNASDLADLRATQLEGLPGRCTIRRLAQVSDGGTGYTDSYTQLAANVPYRIAPYQNQPREEAVGGQVQAQSWYIVTLPYDQDIAATDRIVDTVTYEVMGLLNAGDWVTAKRVVVARVGG